LQREVREETGYLVEPVRFIGFYSTPYKDDLVLFFEATATGHEAWEPDNEIAEVGFYPFTSLPQPFSAHMLIRFADVMAGKTGVMHVFTDPNEVF
jgi:8-oxo-dGTP diphosphatase